MSFTELKKPDLIEFAEYYGTDLEGLKTVAEFRAKLEEDGLKDEDWQRFVDSKADKVESKPQNSKKVDAKEEDTLLLKMNRQNPSANIMGYHFTTRHPFAVVPVAIAEEIIKNYHGFSIALPSEAESFYN
jgi:hypothetical protein